CGNISTRNPSVVTPGGASAASYSTCKFVACVPEMTCWISRTKYVDVRPCAVGTGRTQTLSLWSPLYAYSTSTSATRQRSSGSSTSRSWQRRISLLRAAGFTLAWLNAEGLTCTRSYTPRPKVAANRVPCGPAAFTGALTSAIVVSGISRFRVQFHVIPDKSPTNKPAADPT